MHTNECFASRKLLYLTSFLYLRCRSFKVLTCNSPLVAFHYPHLFVIINFRSSWYLFHFTCPKNNHLTMQVSFANPFER